MASLANNRYADTGRYTGVKPSALKAGLKTAKTVTGHINASKSINMNAYARRKANLEDKQKNKFGNSLEAWGKMGGALSWRQNDPVFALRSQKAKPTLANVWSEQPNTVWASFTGMVIPPNISQDEYEDHFMFVGTSTRDYNYGEPGSTIGVSLTGLRTIWVGGTDIYAGDRLRWRLPSIDSDTLKKEQEFENVRRQDGRHNNQIMAIWERADPSDVALAPKMWMSRAFEGAATGGSKNAVLSTLFQRPYHVYNQMDTPSYTLDDRMTLVAGQLVFAQWVALATINWLKTRPGNGAVSAGTLPTVDQAFDLLGYGSTGADDSVRTLYGTIFAGMLSNSAQSKFKIAASAAFPEKSKVIADVQKQAAQAQFISTMVAHNAERSRVPLTAVEHAPGWGKVDVFN